MPVCRRIASPDGKTMTVTVTGVNAQGRQVSQVVVFERQLPRSPTMQAMQDYAIELVRIIDSATPLMLGIGDEQSARRPSPGKWSPREIVGHLVDSASNNHQRFLRAQWQDDLVFEGYAQDAWVAAQRYQDAPWRDLVTLWAHFNRHLGRVMAAVPEAIRTRPHARHNLHQLAWRPVPETQPATLDYFMRDYVRHLEHHVRQILGVTWSA